MKKNIIIIIINTIILFGTVGIVGNLSVFVCNPATAFSLALVKIANPSAMLNEAKATFSVNNKLIDENTTNTSSKEDEPVMNSISAKDSKDYTDIQQTPSDIVRLMNKAKKTTTKSKSKGKTSGNHRRWHRATANRGARTHRVPSGLNQARLFPLYAQQRPQKRLYRQLSADASPWRNWQAIF